MVQGSLDIPVSQESNNLAVQRQTDNLYVFLSLLSKSTTLVVSVDTASLPIFGCIPSLYSLLG